MLLRNLAKMTPGSVIGEYVRYDMPRMLTLTANIPCAARSRRCSRCSKDSKSG